MSHIVAIEAEVRDADAVRAACKRMGLPVPVHATKTLFVEEVSGFVVELPDWTYPLMVDLETGKLHYDNYEGAWGDPAKLDQFVQSYAIENAKLVARKQGHRIVEQPLEDGSVKLTVTLGA